MKIRVVLSQNVSQSKNGHRNRVNILFLTRKKRALTIAVFIAEIIMHCFETAVKIFAYFAKVKLILTYVIWLV